MLTDSPVKPAAAPARIRLPIVAGSYVTDDRSLFRCVAADLSGDPEGTALLEDCRTLEPLVLPLEEMYDGGIRIVRP